MQVYRIDKEGFYVRPVLVKDDEIPANCIIETPPNGFYSPKWNGDKWIEGKSQEEIDEIENRPKEPSETEKIQLAMAELIETLAIKEVL